MKDKAKNQYRSAWEQLAKEFLSIYKSDPNWPNQPAALLRCAEVYAELAKRSFSTKDAQLACDYYEQLAKQHKKSSLADDALYSAAKLHATLLRDTPKALELLEQIKKSYPKGDMLIDAVALEKTLKTQTNAKQIKPIEQPVKADNPKPSVSQAKVAQQYGLCKEKFQSLLNDKQRSCWRQPWEKLESEFLNLHRQSTNPTLAAGALFRAGQSRHYLAKCSQQQTDYQRAVEILQSLPESFPTSALADDAMYLAAQILVQNLKDKRQSQKLLTDLLRRYPKGDMAASARTDLRKMTAAAGKKHIQLQVLSWDSIDKNKVKITLELTGQAEFTAKLVAGKKGQPKKQLYVDLNDIYIAQSIRKGVVIRGSLLQGIFVEQTPQHPSVLRFDLRDAKRFAITRDTASHNLIIVVDASKNVVPMDERRGNNVASSKDLAPRSASTAFLPPITGRAKNVNNMAQQLGLSIHTIFIDPGHGGKDPGTYHNNIVERLVTLDVAKTLGKLLENSGFKVVYSRATDRFISLSQRTLAANMARADLFISIHVNAHENQDINGFETYYLDLSRSQSAARVAALENAGSDRRLGDLQRVLAEIMLTARADESARLAIDIQRVTLSRLRREGKPARNNGVKSAPFHVLIGTQMPAVLVELGYCTNPKEAQLLANADYREMLAKGLAEGIMAYRDRLTKQHTVENSLTPASSGAI